MILDLIKKHNCLGVPQSTCCVSTITGIGFGVGTYIALSNKDLTHINKNIGLKEKNPYLVPVIAISVGSLAALVGGATVKILENKA